MPQETSQTQEIDLEKTDRLPALDMAKFDQEFADDAVPMDYPGGGPHAARGVVQPADFVRPSSLDLPSLAETVRSVEERIARQNAEHEALERSYQKALEAESAAVIRANALAAELASMRTALDVQQARARDFEKALEEKIETVEHAEDSAKDALREAERLAGETRALKDSLAARDSNIAQVLHSLGERDAQLLALQQEHARIIPELEERYRTGSQLESDLQSARARAAALDLELNQSRSTVGDLSDQVRRREAELSSARNELDGLRVRSVSYLENLSTRNWRQGYHLNAIGQLEAEVGAAQASAARLEAERDGLKGQVEQLTGELDYHRHAIQELQASVASHVASLSAKDAQLCEREQALADFGLKVADLQAEQTCLSEQLATRDAAIEAAQSSGSEQLRQLNEMLEAAQQKSAEQASEIDRLQAESEVTRQEINSLSASLREARRPIELVEAEVQRLNGELAAMTARGNELEADNAKLRSTLERTRGALEEREFLIRRLERSESNNANVLGRIQTSIERLGVTPPAAGAPRSDGARSDMARADLARADVARADVARADIARADIARADIEWAVEMVRIDGGKSVSHVLGKRTRVGRATGCELQIESSSVSRHHALILVGPRDIVIEDLNSTNGVYINGRKVSRQVLNDGDTLTIGEAQFRFSAKQVPRPREVPPRESQKDNPPGQPQPGQPQG